MNLSENIKKYRKEKKVTQKELAKKLNKSESTIQKYESGSVTPDIKTLTDIAEILGVTINDLIGLGNEYNRAASLSDTYFNSVMKWSEDKAFNDIETICIREHFFDLLLRYKQLIESFSGTKYRWLEEKEAYSSIYNNMENPLTETKIKEIFLKKELEHDMYELENWVNAFPSWMIRRETELDSNNKEDDTE
ncbi:MAG: helix-turn-helix transcriptional regulator [Clostridiaceae bacterium]|nr:helix-turn-helix transcriptional regulator [Clostridiaceae bacterium]